MFTVFVTGPLASGKHVACQYLAKHGFTHIDLDDVAKEFLDDESVQEQLINAYGIQICDEKGSISKPALAKEAFAGEGSSDALNAIIWPLVKARLADILVGAGCQLEPTNEKFAIEIVMLAEAPDMLELADSVLCVTADESIRIERALARGMQLQDIEKRIALQATDEEREALCDVIINNNGSLEMLYAKLDTWLRCQQKEHLF